MAENVVRNEITVEMALRFLERERSARQQAETLLEKRSRELFDLNAMLEQQYQLSNAIFEGAGEGIIVFDHQGRSEILNEAARRIFGLCEESLPPIRELIPVEELDLEVGPDSSCSIQQQRELIKSLETTGIRAGGECFPLELTVSAFCCGGAVRYTCIARDLTRRKALESQLALSRKMESIGQLAAGIAHELNSPIQYVADNTRFLKDSYEVLGRYVDRVEGLLDELSTEVRWQSRVEEIRSFQQEVDLDFVSEEVPAALEQSLYGAEVVTQIVAAMKDFSQLQCDHFKQADINLALKNTLTVCRSQWSSVAELETELADDLPLVDCLPAELNQVFLNLIANAAHAVGQRWRPELGTIKIRSRYTNDRAIVEIIDNGHGIPEEIRHRIFDPFFTTKEVGKGTGQGLSVCHRIVVELHRGELTFDSRLNEGATFRVEIPLRRASTVLGAKKVIENPQEVTQ